MLPKNLNLDILLEATQIYGIFRECEDIITVNHRGNLLDKLESKYIPILIKHKDLPQARRILVEYNRNITMNIYDNKPVNLN